MFYRINGSIINENFINRVDDVTNELKSGTYDQDVRKKIESGVHYFSCVVKEFGKHDNP
jgi:hypothetical protein